VFCARIWGRVWVPGLQGALVATASFSFGCNTHTVRIITRTKIAANVVGSTFVIRIGPPIVSVGRLVAAHQNMSIETERVAIVRAASMKTIFLGILGRIGCHLFIAKNFYPISFPLAYCFGGLPGCSFVT